LQIGLFDVIIAPMNTLTATKRSKADKLASVRSNGMVPAVVYGARVENTMISVPSVDFVKILKVAGESSTIVLELKGDETKKEAIQKIDVLIHDMQVDPIKGFPIHVDFLAIDMNKPVEVAIPVEFIGIAPAEKNSLGVLVKVMHEIEVEALPKDLPHNITVDVSILEVLDAQIHVKDIKLPKGVKMVTDGEEVVALISAIKEEVIETIPVDLSAIEVEKKGKKDLPAQTGEVAGEEKAA
jgi:large subunit ribosomal protein L25